MLLDKNHKNWRVRRDGAEKVTGELRYLTDLSDSTMLIGKIVRAGIPHAKIKAIDVSKAEALEGVKAILTFRDVPGLNGYGINQPDQPVFCHDVVRYEGDAIAAIAAIDEKVAEAAAALIEVTYDMLAIIDSPEAALEPDSPKLHPGGNILHQTDYTKGDVETMFAGCAYIVEEVYMTPRQMHAYMETEGGLFIPEENGYLTVYAPTQHGYKDRMQLSRILGCEEEKIRIISSPIGGSFGGKDELNVQPYGALLALRCGVPVKVHQSRQDSVKAGLKRHPMKIKMKTGMDSNGKLVAHSVDILSDTGAYSTMGAPVLNFATEHAIGPYSIPNVKVNGTVVYTNNGLSGEFRGFGGNQVIFALEGQMDRLAEMISIDAWELRGRNLRASDDLGPLGQKVIPTIGPDQVWEAAMQSKLWNKTVSSEWNATTPWIKRGVGAAIAMHGSGLGYGIPDHAGGLIRLNNQGQIEVAFGHEEFGQGLIPTLEIMLLDHFNCEPEDLSIMIGDTDLVPQSGSSTASRTTNMVWQSLNRLKGPFLEAMYEYVGKVCAVPLDQLEIGRKGVWIKDSDRVISFAEMVQNGQTFEFNTQFHYPVTPDPIIGAHYLYSSIAAIVEVEVNELTGMVRVIAIDHAVAAGPVMNPMGYVGQIEGGSIMAMGFTLTEDAIINDGSYVTKNFDTYLIPSIYDVPEDQHVEAIEELPDGDVFGPRGVGEIGSVALAPAIVSAVHKATGKWVKKLPISPEELIESPFSVKKRREEKV
ncbi:xanthine dehydrogenase subunit D [Bacillus suaedae]|uniref:Xanthine dehydrogenase subunit D n=1 Tax=Halalkalibacter suaedae TaxID=2822140 RepID=A0A941ATR0_9BACI|nr:xanthine dehydrogenase subunit D [Bacillus suaedae]MBP3952454.1 xanthine dehydrogenase subunit D [Bacillus suaedae]